MNDETKGAIAVLIIGLVAIVMTVFGRCKHSRRAEEN